MAKTQTLRDKVVKMTPEARKARSIKLQSKKTSRKGKLSLREDEELYEINLHRSIQENKRM